MARRKTGDTIDVDELSPPGTSPALVPGMGAVQTEYDDVTALNRVLDEVGAIEGNEGFVSVFRENRNASGRTEDEFIQKFPVSDFSLDNLKAEWGPGRYKISVYHGGGQGLATRRVITIAKSPIADTPPAVAQNTDLTPVLAAIREGNDNTLKAILALAQASQIQQPSRMDMLREMSMMREIMGPATVAPVAPPLDIMGLIKLGAEMSGSGGGESTGSWLDKMLDRLGPVLAPAMAEAMSRREPTPAAPRPAALPSHVGVPDQPVTPNNPEENPMNMIVVGYLNMLASAAAANKPAAEYADSIVGMIPPANLAEVEAILKPENWREAVRQRTNVIDKHPEWFGQLRDLVLQYIEEDRQLAGEGSVSANLTPETVAGSVHPHENGDTGKPADDCLPGATP